MEDYEPIFDRPVWDLHTSYIHNKSRTSKKCVYSVLFASTSGINNWNELISLYSCALCCHSLRALLFPPSQPEPATSKRRDQARMQEQGAEDAELAQGVHLCHLPHAPAPAWIISIGFSCSAETLASAAATAPADSCDQKVGLDPSQQLRSICDHWSLGWGQEQQSVSVAVSAACKARSSDCTASTVLGLETLLRISRWLRGQGMQLLILQQVSHAICSQLRSLFALATNP